VAERLAPFEEGFCSVELVILFLAGCHTALGLQSQGRLDVRVMYECHARARSEIRKEIDILEEVGVDGRIILKFPSRSA
jgi:hypothetical protein